jgi:class 3 adenylate cyclase
MSDIVFRETFRKAMWDQPIEATALSKSIRSSTYQEVGVLDHQDLAPGETRAAKLVCAFIDIRGFTKVALASPMEMTVRTLNAVILATNAHFRSYGGQILDYSDGAMAVFEAPDLTHAIWSSLEASAFLLRGIQMVVNEDLGQRDDPTVRAAVGMEAGDVLWTRLGDDTCSQVKPVSGVTFLAGKNASGGHTNSWETLMGMGIAAYVPDHLKIPAESYDFQYKNEQFRQPRWRFDWETYLSAYATDRPGLLHSLATAASARAAQVSAVPRRSTPTRPLRDAPFA